MFSIKNFTLFIGNDITSEQVFLEYTIDEITFILIHEEFSMWPRNV